MQPHESRVLATGQWAAVGGEVTMMPVVVATAAAPIVAVDATNDAAPGAAPTGSSSLRPNELSSSSSWHVGQVVLVKARTWPG
jgi:hypothetical protein